MGEIQGKTDQHVDALKSVIRGLHEGEDQASVKQRLKALVSSTTSDQVVAMEQSLIDDGMPVDEVRKMCDLHAEVLREVLDGDPLNNVTPGHPIDVMRRENQALKVRLTDLRAVITAIQTPALQQVPDAVLRRFRDAVTDLAEVDKHYARKENLLFPYLEKYGISGPGQVMWGKDDEVRELLKALREALAEDDASVEEWRQVAQHIAAPMAEQIEGMFYKEERVLLPTALEKLRAEEWAAIASEGARFGYCLIDEPPPFGQSEDQAELPTSDGPVRVSFGAGALSPDQLRGLMNVLPLDLTFVDADDRVAFFSEGDRIFPRSLAVIGRKVQFCHPPKSMGMVTQILDDFRSGQQDRAEFWIQMGPRFVHIRYFAVRDDDKNYLGCLETSQDLAPLRALEGERRLLSYESAGTN